MGRPRHPHRHHLGFRRIRPALPGIHRPWQAAARQESPAPHRGPRPPRHPLRHLYRPHPHPRRLGRSHHPRDHLTTDSGAKLPRSTAARSPRKPRTPRSPASSRADWLDFGNLPEPLQQGIIERLAGNRQPLRSPGRDRRHHPARSPTGSRPPSPTARPTATPRPTRPLLARKTIRASLTALYQDLVDQPAAPFPRARRADPHRPPRSRISSISCSPRWSPQPRPGQASAPSSSIFTAPCSSPRPAA